MTEKDTKPSLDGLTDSNLKLIDDFFAPYSHAEIADNGFSRRVMRRLPAPGVGRLVRVWTAACAAAALVLFCFADGFALLKGSLLNMAGDLVGMVANVSTAGHMSPLTLLFALVVACAVALANAGGGEEHLL